MITATEVQRSLEAAWGLLLGRREAMRLLDTSDAGFWRSFQAIAIIAPLYAIIALADWRAAQASVAPGMELPFSEGAFWISRAVLLGLDWVTLPILLAALGGFLGIRQRYAAFIVARNWSNVLGIAVFAGIAFLDFIGILPGDAILIPSLVALAFALRLSYMVARIALAVPIEVAIGFVAFDFLVSLALARLISRLFGVELA